MNASGTWVRIPAPSPLSASAPTAPRWLRFARAVSAASTMSRPGVPRSVATKATPQASCSAAGSYRPAEGLYDPAAEHDACGVAFVATRAGTPGRDIVDAALTALANLNHRGAVGAEADSGDGARILTHVPDAFIRDVVGADLPAPGHYAIGLAFLPTDPDAQHDAVVGVEKVVRDEGLELLAWRDVPVKPCLLYTSDAADDLTRVGLGGGGIDTKKNCV